MMRRCRRRPAILLEVLISFALIVLCALPLIYPNVFILRSEQKYIATVELDHLVNLLYVEMLQKLYLNEIPWSDIEGEKEVPIEPSMLQRVGYTEEFPFVGTYRFITRRHKPKDPSEKMVYLFDLVFTFIPKKGIFLEKEDDKFSYEYQVVVEKHIK